MAAGKYIDVVSGIITQKASVDSSAGAGDAGKLVSLNASGMIDATMLDGTYTANVGTGPVANGDLVYITAAGLLEPAKADAVGTIAMGFCLVGATTGNPATMYLAGDNTAVSGLTVGAEYYLDDSTAGAITATPPSTSNHYQQPIGFAVSATRLHFDRQRASKNA
jgi:hypothetical protein